MYQAHYTKLLSSHFSEEQLETLIKLIGIMQDPLQMKAGVKELVKQGLYDPFVNFLEKYMKEKGMLEYDPQPNEISPLITYMFSRVMNAFSYKDGRKITLAGTLDVANGIVATQVIFPIFSKGLIYRIADGFSKTPFKFSNSEDVIHPIEKLGLIIQRKTGELNLNVKKMELFGVQQIDAQQHYFSAQLEALKLRNITLTPDCILHLNNLTRLEIVKCSNILLLKFPPNILHIVCDWLLSEDVMKIAKHLIKNNPNLQTLEMLGEGGYFKNKELEDECSFIQCEGKGKYRRK